MKIPNAFLRTNVEGQPSASEPFDYIYSEKLDYQIPDGVIESDKAGCYVIIPH